MLTTDLHYRDYAYLKKLGNSYKLILCNEVRKKNLETVDVKTEHDYLYSRKGYNHKLKVIEIAKTEADFSCSNDCNGKVKDTSNDEKLANNICRARNKILEYVLCNDFVFFVTLTLNPAKYDRHNLSNFIKDLGNFIQNYNRRKNADIKYLLIPEEHKDESWHMHGFIMGLPYDRLELLELHGNRPLPPKIIEKIQKGYLVYSFPEYENRFGYNLFEPIRSKKASALYMSKYLTKDISRNVKELGNHLYYCSKGLKKAEVIKQGQFLDCDFNFDFKNEYGGQSFFDMLSDDELEELKSKIGGEPVSLDDYKKGYRKKDGWQEFIDTDTGEIIGNGYKEMEVFGWN